MKLRPEDEALATARNPFCETLPTMQKAWDATSLNFFQECPRKYKFTVIDRLRKKNPPPPLVFGKAIHDGLEKFHARIAHGMPHDEAVKEVFDWLWENHGGSYNPEGKWVPWYTTDKNRNVATLLRTFVWYTERFKDDPVEPLVLEGGRPAVEVNFVFPIDLECPDGDSYLFCGHIDKLGQWGKYVVAQEHKSTTMQLGSKYFNQYNPNIQVSMYTTAGRVILERPAKGVLIDAMQMGWSFSRFERSLVGRSKQLLDEWVEEKKWWIKQAEDCAKNDYWPGNDASCSKYGGCPFRDACSKGPGTPRKMFLNASFEPKEQWNPLEPREVG